MAVFFFCLERFLGGGGDWGGGNEANNLRGAFNYFIVFLYMVKRRASRYGEDLKMSGGGHLLRQFRWDNTLRGNIFSFFAEWFLCKFLQSYCSIMMGGGVHIFVERFIKCCDSAVWVVLLSRLIFLTSGINSRSRLWNQTGFEQSLAFSVHICYSFVITTDCLCEI